MVKEYSKGFTLIELSIVLLIIALLVAGIVIGKQLIEVAEIRGIVSEVGQIQSALKTFELKYHCKAGDCKNAAAFGLGTSGTGNERLDLGYNSSYSCSPADNDISANIFRSFGECQLIWVHLGNAGLISGQYQQLGDIGATSTADMAKYFYKSNYAHSFIYPMQWLGRTWLEYGMDSMTAFTHASFKATVKGSTLQAVMQTIGVAFSPYTLCNNPYACYTPDTHPLLQPGKRVVPMSDAPGGGQHYGPPAANNQNPCSDGTKILPQGNCNFLIQIEY